MRILLAGASVLATAALTFTPAPAQAQPEPYYRCQRVEPAVPGMIGRRCAGQPELGPLGPFVMEGASPFLRVRCLSGYAQISEYVEGRDCVRV